MGSAISVVARDRGHDVALVGTWLDDEFVRAAAAGEAHPRLKLAIPGVRHLIFDERTAALESADVVVIASTSDGVLPVLGRVGHGIARAGVIGCVSKGFVEDSAHWMTRISEVLRERFPTLSDRWVAMGGPAKAMEVARGVPTAFVFGAAKRDVADRLAVALQGGHVHIETTNDLAGVEASMALKNAYATAGGLWDGLAATGRVEGGAAHNAKAWMFAQAIREIASVVVALGGRAETVYGFAGVGDLHVTAAAGRNRAYGDAVGRGGDPATVGVEMSARGELTEGYPAIRTAWRLVNERGLAASTPLLVALHAIIYERAPVEATLRNLANRLASI